MKIIKRLFTLLTIGIMAMSCSKMSSDKVLSYNNSTMGNVVDGKFVSDKGNTFNIVSQTCAGKLDTLKRAFIICDVLNEVEGKKNEYDVRLHYLTSVLTKNALYSSEIEDMGAVVNDPIILSNGWISGGYFNMEITIPVKRNSKVKHEINLIYDQREAVEGTYKFLVRHNASGEIFDDNTNSNNMTLASAYVSFPISDIIKEDSAKIHVEWLSYDIIGGTISSNTEIQTANISYVKE